MVKPWESKEGACIWKTEAAYWTWVRGALRRLWKDYPLRQQWKKDALRPVTPEERKAKVFHPSTKNVGMCVFCEDWMAGSKLECDHIAQSEGCTSKETAEKFLWHCGGLTGAFFQLACKPCHKIKSHSEKKGVTFEEARCDKEAIQICKGNESAWLVDVGIVPQSNAKKRREQVYAYLLRVHALDELVISSQKEGEY